MESILVRYKPLDNLVLCLSRLVVLLPASGVRIFPRRFVLRLLQIRTLDEDPRDFLVPHIRFPVFEY